MFIAEREGFEPPEPRSSTVFKTAAIDHSAISPATKVQPFFDFSKTGLLCVTCRPDGGLNSACLYWGSVHVRLDERVQSSGTACVERGWITTISDLV